MDTRSHVLSAGHGNEDATKHLQKYKFLDIMLLKKYYTTIILSDSPYSPF